MFYLPSALVGFYFLSLWWEDNEGGDHPKSRGALGAIMVTVHFTKRTLESLFLHKYSGSMPVSSSVNVSFGYAAVAASMCIYSSKRESFGLDDVYMKYFILIAFAIGEIGNLHHHYLLSTLRKPGEKEYKVPHGGLFEYVAAPHYLFEIIAFMSMTIIAQHMTIFLYFVAVVVYLCDRAVAQSEWNRENLKGKYPLHRKHIVPFIF